MCVAIVCGVGLAGAAATDGAGALWTVGPWLALTALSCWATFWRPEVVVDDGGIHVVNVFRTIDVPWPSLRAVDTKWALTLITDHGRFTAWAAPAPGRRSAARHDRGDLRRLPSGMRVAGAIRPGDLPGSESGSAALLIRRRWERLRDAGHLDGARLEHESAPITWHLGWIGASVALIAMCAAGLR